MRATVADIPMARRVIQSERNQSAVRLIADMGRHRFAARRGWNGTCRGGLETRPYRGLLLLLLVTLGHFEQLLNQAALLPPLRRLRRGRSFLAASKAA